MGKHRKPREMTTEGQQSPTPGKGQRTNTQVRKRSTGKTSNTTTRAGTGGNAAAGDNMWKFYSEDSPGVKIGPVPVLVISLMFIAAVFIMHIWGKYNRV